MITVIAYNLEYAKATTPEKVAAELSPFQPDLVCLCEVPDGGWTAEMAAGLGMAHHVVGTIASAHHADSYADQSGRFHGKFKAIISRQPVREEQEITLVGSGWQPASVVLGRTTCAGVELILGALHIPSGRGDAGHCCARHLSEVLEDFRGTPMVIGGDYNDLADSAPLAHLHHSGFHNPWLETGFAVDSAKTCNAKTDEDAGVIDHLLYRGRLRATRAEILYSATPQSDHYPILAVLAPG